MLLLFIAHLHASKLAPASIISMVSAVGYFHKINGFTDPATSFLVTKLLAGARNLGAVPDVRLPVTLPMLGRLLGAILVVFTSGYKCLMRHVDQGVIGVDQRGRHGKQRSVNEGHQAEVRNHINSFPRIESHNCRQSTSREYLVPHLSVAKMYALYKE